MAYKSLNVFFRILFNRANNDFAAESQWRLPLVKICSGSVSPEVERGIRNRILHQKMSLTGGGYSPCVFFLFSDFLSNVGREMYLMKP